MSTEMAAIMPATEHMPIYGAVIGQDKAVTTLEDTVNRLLTTLRGVEHGTKAGQDPNQAPPGGINESVHDIAKRILSNSEVVERMSKQIDEITDELARVRIGMGI